MLDPRKPDGNRCLQPRYDRCAGSRQSRVHCSPDVPPVDWTFKWPGRVGDSPITGHGLYVDPKIVWSCGHGSRRTGSWGYAAVSLCCGIPARGACPEEAVTEVLLPDRHCLSATLPGKQAAATVSAADGRWAAGALRPGFQVAMCWCFLQFTASTPCYLVFRMTPCPPAAGGAQPQLDARWMVGTRRQTRFDPGAVAAIRGQSRTGRSGPTCQSDLGGRASASPKTCCQREGFILRRVFCSVVNPRNGKK